MLCCEGEREGEGARERERGRGSEGEGGRRRGREITDRLIEVTYYLLHQHTSRLESIAVDAELQEKSLSELERLADTLHESCLQAVAEHTLRLVVAE